MVMSRAHKWLLAWSVVFMIAATLLANAKMEEKTATWTGAIEITLAIVTGIAFGLASAKIKK
ncbi:MAG: hypothetical protein L0229_30395 [Blastocatellia bacterium]|nr:hypothetical protein [Blastocatellia bacterium]